MKVLRNEKAKYNNKGCMGNWNIEGREKEKGKDGWKVERQDGR